MSTAVQPFSGSYLTDPVHSHFGFVVRYGGVSDFRGTLGGVQATLTATDAGLTLEGSAPVESISIREPEPFRAHVLGPEFFDTENHPDVSFRSDRIALSDDGSARVEGELTMSGVTRPIVATGTWNEPRPGMGGLRTGLELRTEIDRRDFGFDWQMELPGGGEALDYTVKLEVTLSLLQPDEQPA